MSTGLAAAGLLDRKRAVTHWNFCDRLAREFPKVNVLPDPILLRDGLIYTSAGITAGIAGQAFQESLSEDGSHLYTISQRSSASTPAGQGNVLHTLVIQSDGTVSETAPPVDFNQPGGARPQGVAVVDR